MPITKDDMINLSIPEEEIEAFEKSLGIDQNNINENNKEEEKINNSKKKSSNKKTNKKNEEKEIKEDNNENSENDNSNENNNNNDDDDEDFERLENRKYSENKIENFLKNIDVDINNIDIVNTDEIEQFEDIKNIFSSKSIYQIVCNQSCYVAFMEPLNMRDINGITNSTLDNYQSKLKLYQTIYNRINRTSLGSKKFSFETFLKITSFFDLSSLLYGLYMQTFPGSTDFDITCRHCKKTISVSINNDSLISVKDDKIYDQMQRIFKNISSPEEALKHSLVNKFEKIILPDSKIIVEIQTPSLQDQLNLLSSIDFSKLKDDEDTATTLMFIKKIYVMDLKASKRAGKAKYFIVDKQSEIFNVLKSLSINDMRELATKLSERLDKYSIEFKIKGFDCTNCHKDVGDIPIDIERLLFRQILQL